MKKNGVYGFPKRLVHAALALLISFLAVSTAPAAGESPIIVIDPGHGGVDGGTGGGGMLEKDINLDIAKRLKSVLEQKGYTAEMTRETDTSLDKQNSSSKSRHKRDLIARTEIINSRNAAIFLSIHVNSNYNMPSMDGSYVFFCGKSEKSRALAEHVQKALNSISVQGKHRTKNPPLKGRYHVLVKSKIPGVLVETAFISNYRERELLKTPEFRQQLAEAIGEGISSYMSWHCRMSSADKSPPHAQAAKIIQPGKYSN